MWRRNGFSLINQVSDAERSTAVSQHTQSVSSIKLFQTNLVCVFQIYYYHNVKCRVEMFDKDIVMLQVYTITATRIRT